MTCCCLDRSVTCERPRRDLMRERPRHLPSSMPHRFVDVSSKHLIMVLYVLAGILLAASIIPFLYQYVAAVGSYSDVIPAFGNARILTALWLSFLSACITTVLAMVFGVPLAYFFARTEFN